MVAVYTLTALVAHHAAGQDPAGDTPPATAASPPAETSAVVEEVRPELFYLKDDAGGLVPVPGFGYRDFVEMLRLKDGLPRGPQPPPASITSVSLEGRIGDRECLGSVEVKVVQAEAGWVSVPLALEGMRFTEPPDYAGPGRFVVDVDRATDTGGYRAWFEAAAGGEHVLVLRGAVAVERSAAQEAVIVDLPRATASSVRLTTQLVDPLVVVDPQRLPAVVSPLTESVPNETGDEADDEPSDGVGRPVVEKGSVVAITGLAGRARIRLREPRAMTPESIAAPQAVGEILVRVDGRRAMSDVTLRLAGLPTDARTVTVRLPANGTVAAVRPPSALLEPRGDAARPEAVFSIERSNGGEATLRFDCETPVDLAQGKVLEALAYAVEGIPDWRQWGRVSLLVNGDWQVSWGPVPANRRVDPPPTVDRQTCVGAFAYDSQPARMPLQVKPLGSRVVVEPEYGYTVGSSRIELDVRLRVSVRGAPISQIEIGLDGWGIDSVGPSSLVDGSSLTGAAGRLVIPFVKPLSGNGTVELRATRLIARTDETVSWSLPSPRADVVGPASVTIVADSDIELVPDAKLIRGLVRQVATASAGKGAEAATLAYRLEGGTAEFVAARRFLPRRVDASVAARATVDRNDTLVEENVRLDVAYVPLESVALAVPRSILDGGSLEVRHNDQLLSLREEALPAAPEEPSAAVSDGLEAPGGVAVVRTELPSPRLGAVDLRIRYTVKTPEVPEETTVPQDLPLVVPREGRVARQSFTVDSQSGLTVEVRGEQWKRDTSSSSSPTAVRSWVASKHQETVPIALSAERRLASAPLTTVEAAWIVTRLLPDRREDTFRYRISTAAPSLLVTLPASSLAAGDLDGSIEMRLDGRSVSGEIQPGGRMLVDLAASGGVGEHLLEIEQVQPRPSLLQPLALDAPQFGEGAVQRRFYWELRLQPDEHVVRQPSGWTSQQQWRWTRSGPRRLPLVSTESLEDWLVGRNAPTDRSAARMPPMAEARSVYAGVGWPDRGTAWVAPRWLCVLAVSGPLLLLGLAIVYRPRVRAVPVLVSIATAAVAMAMAFPDLMPLVAESALPGAALTALAAALKVAVTPRRRPDDTFRGGSVVISGSSTRAVATPSLVIGSTARAEIDGPSGLVMLIAVTALVAGAARGEDPPAAEPLRFMRVHVPTGRVPPDMLGPGRYVPVPVAEFDAAVGSSSASGPPGDLAARGVTTAAYSLAWSPAGGLEGRLEFSVDESLGRFPFVVTVPGFRPVDATVESRHGTGVASIIGAGGGTLAVVVRSAGLYRCGLRGGGAMPSDSYGTAEPIGPVAGSPRGILTIPIIAALATTIDLAVPQGVFPVAEGAAARLLSSPPGQAARNERTFRIELGPVAAIRIRLEPSLSPVPLASTSRVTVERGEFRVSTSLVPARPWNRESFSVDLDPGLVVSGAWAEQGPQVRTPLFHERISDGAAPGGGRIRLTLPDSTLGRMMPVVVEAMAAFDRREGAPVPLVRPLPDEWASGMVLVSLDRVTTFQAVEVEAASIVDMPQDGPAASDGIPSVAIEQQSSGGSVRLSVTGRPPEIDTARVTTVDITGGTVTGRAAASVGVRRGVAFELKAQVGPEWLIDSVEIPGEPVEFDWSVDAATPSRTLRISLVRGIAPGRDLVVRVVGHRAPLPLNQPVQSSRLDMIRFEGEARGRALLDLRTNAETTILVGGVAAFPLPLEDLPGRLRGLAESAAPRARLPAGELVASREVTILRRRPPVDVQAQIRVTSRDDRLSESFTFECTPRDSEIDSVVVWFSEADDAPMEWTVLAPAAAKATARRDGAVGRGALVPAGADSWLVEVSPPVRGPVTIRATRNVPFRAARAIPLAWVEGAAHAGGEIFIRDAGRERSTVLSSRLPEIPGSKAAGAGATPVATFTFDVARDLGAERSPVVQLAPGAADPASARAWAWTESTTTRCHESGVVEYETTYLLENRGRTGIMLQMAADRRLEEISVDGVRLSNPAGSGAEIPVELPAGRRQVRLEIRMLAERKPWLGGWSVEPGGVQIDAPILDRSWNLLLPPAIAVAVSPSGYRDTDAVHPSLVERLSGFTAPAGEGGFRSFRFVPSAGPGDVGAAMLIRQETLARFALAALVVGMLAGVGCVGRRSGVVIVAVLVAGLAMLWAPTPWFHVARWGLGGLILGAAFSVARAARSTKSEGRMVATVAATLALAVPFQPAGAAEPMVERVFVTPGGSGPVALVPETLYRAIAAAGGRREDTTTGAVRSRLVAGADAGVARGPWRLEVEFDGTAGDRFSIVQAPDEARFVVGGVQLDGMPVPDAVSADRRTVAVGVGGFGKHVLVVEVDPKFIERGGVEEAVIGMPTAADSTVGLPLEWLPDGESPHACEWSDGDAVWHEAQLVDGGTGGLGEFDVSGADRIRLTRSRDRAVALVRSPATAACDNAIEWDVGECRLTVSIEADASGGRRTDRLCRGVALWVDPRLEAIPPDGGLRAGWTTAADADGRLRLEWSEPRSGPQTAQLAFRMPLATPVGVFEVPLVVPAETGSGAVEARLRTVSPSLRVTAALPDSAVPKPPSGEDVVGRFIGWSARTPVEPVTVAVTRRDTEPTGFQQSSARFGPTAVALRLEGQLRATGNAVARIAVAIPRGCVVDAARVIAVDSAASVEPAMPLDARGFRESDERFVVVLQNPRTGRMQIEIDARLPGRPSPVGPLPVMRLEALEAEPLPVSWSVDGDFEIAFGAAGDSATSAGGLEIAAGQPPPRYRLIERKRRADAVPPGAAAAAETSRVGDDFRAARTADDRRVELAEVRLAIDDRGRGWGVVRFDLVTDDPSIRIRLPEGLRLFEAFVDDHPLAAKPADANAWEARLLDTTRPRSVVAVFAGDLGRSVSGGQAVELPAPAIDSMPVREVLWTIRGPRDRTIRFLPGPLQSSPEAVAEARRAALERLTPDVVRAFEGRTPDEQASIRSFLDREDATQEASPEAMWDRSSRDLAPDACVRADDGEGSVRFRIARPIDSTLPLRVIATLTFVAFCGIAWRSSRHRRGGAGADVAGTSDV